MSKEYLEAFEVIRNKFIDLFHEDIPDFDTVENALIKAQEIEKEIAYIEKIKTMMKQKDCVLRYIESEDCFAVKTILSDEWYKLTPAFVDDNAREEIKPLPLIEKIKQLKEENAKLKAKAQEPKHYLKWEDLEFKEEEQTIKVLLNDSCYLLNYYKRSEEEFVFIKSTGTTIFNLLGKCSDDKQLFNDLHLERVEE